MFKKYSISYLLLAKFAILFDSQTTLFLKREGQREKKLHTSLPVLDIEYTPSLLEVHRVWQADPMHKYKVCNFIIIIVPGHRTSTRADWNPTGTKAISKYDH